MYLRSKQSNTIQKSKKVKVTKRAAKPEDKKIDFDNSDSDEDMFVPDELEMLSYNHGSELQDIEYRSDHRAEVNQLFHTSAGIGTTWGKPNHSNLMAEQKKLERLGKCKENRGSAGKRAQGQKAEDCNVQATLKAYCLDKKNDNYDRVIAEGRCKYIELYQCSMTSNCFSMYKIH